MLRLLKRLVTDDAGMILSSEIVLVGTILVIGSIAGLTSLQYAVTHELNDTARAYDSWQPWGPDGDQHDYSIHDSEGTREVACDAW